MSDFIIAHRNGRNIPKEDKIFGISKRANQRIEKDGKDKVVNGTVGSLLDDDGNLVVLSSVVDVLTNLKPDDYAAYSLIGGLKSFKTAVKKAAFGSFEPTSITKAVATPGGTGAIRNAIANYTSPGDKVLTADWFWAPYSTIAQEIGRSIDTFALFDGSGKFNVASFEERVETLSKEQGSLLIILNTPANNPTGYSLTDEDWNMVIKVLTEAAVPGITMALLVDVAYIDFAGDEEEYRSFYPLLEKLPENVLPIIAYSTSKTFTCYGMRCGAMICMAKTQEIADEFNQVCKYSSRGSWSNSNRAAQETIARIYADQELLDKVTIERKGYRDMLLKRGRAFEAAADEAGLQIVPFDAGFFVSIPCDNPDEVSAELEKEGIFLVPLAKGLRVSIASVPEEKCRMLPARILDVMNRLK